MRGHDRVADAGNDRSLQIAKAFDQLAERRSLQLASRIITRLNRELTAAVKLFAELRKKVPIVVEEEPVQIEPNELPQFDAFYAKQTQPEAPPPLRN